LVNTGNATLNIYNVAVTAGSLAFSETDNCFGVDLSADGSCTINVTFTPRAGGTSTGTLTITDNAGGVSGSTQTVSLTGTGALNSVSAAVIPGPAGTSANMPLTTLTVCQPGTTNCTTIENVLVDTGSVGLRVFSNQLGNVTLPSITDASGDTLYECVEYADLTYQWGPVQWATVQIGGESAPQLPPAYGTANMGIPIQVISAPGTGVAAPSIPCTSGGGGPANTVSSLGAYGILGVGNNPYDCPACTYSPSYTNPSYLYCTSSGTCTASTVSPDDQAWNPVAAFSSSDTNGVVLQLPSIPASGAAGVTGSLIFGINTESNNAMPDTATVYAVDEYGFFESVVLGGTTYVSPTNPGFLDSGTTIYHVSDHATLTSLTGISTVDCTGTTVYCPASTLNFDITVNGSNDASGTVPLSIANAFSLFSANPSYVAFDDIGGESGTSPANDFFDLGLPFFFGRTVFVGIAGTSLGNVAYNNGYWAF
jgi:hypothetical protein